MNNEIEILPERRKRDRRKPQTSPLMIYFTSGHVDYLRPENNNRRFWALGSIIDMEA